MRFFISYVNLRHRPHPRARRFRAAEASRFDAENRRTGGAGNSCGQAACVPPRPARGQKAAKVLQTLAFSALSAHFPSVVRSGTAAPEHLSAIASFPLLYRDVAKKQYASFPF